MSESGPSANDKSFLERLWQALRASIAAHPSQTEGRERRQAELLNAIALLLMISLLAGMTATPRDARPFALMLAIAFGAFLLGKTKYARLGAYLFSFGFVTIAFLALRGMGDYFTLILSIVPLTLIAASALLSQRGFSWLIAYAVAAAFLGQLYFVGVVPSSEALRISGIIFSIGLVLYGVNYLRVRMEESRLEEIRETSRQLREARAEMERRAQTYAQEIEAARVQIEKQTSRLQTAAEISQKVAANVNLPLKDLLTNATEIISDRLGFYHVGIFLVDKNRGYAELFASNSEGGRRLLERRHQLKVGGTGIVGYVAQSGFPRIALSTGADAVFFNNPDLPNTQSEMATPIILGNEVVGVLDVQSESPAAFNDEDLAAFSALASQLAFAIGGSINAGQFASQKPQSAFNLSVEESGQRGYVYLSDGTITAAKAKQSPTLQRALQLGEPVASSASADSPFPALTAPVKVRDTVIGYIHIESAEIGRKWTEDEISLAQAVAERAALALENARLFEQTERRAEQEQIMARVAARIAESNRFDNILQTAVRELGQVLNARRAYIQMEAVLPDIDETTAERGLE